MVTVLRVIFQRRKQVNQTEKHAEEIKRHSIRKHSEPIKKSHPNILKQNINLTYQSVYENDDANFSSSSSSEMQSQQIKDRNYSNEIGETSLASKEEISVELRRSLHDKQFGNKSKTRSLHEQ